MTLKCKNCNGDMAVSKDGSTLICPYCDSTELIDESDAVKIQKLQSKTYENVELGKQKIETEKLKYALEKDNRTTEKDELTSFKKGKLSKILIVFFIISAFVSAMELSSGISISGIIALTQAILYISAWLIGMQVFKPKFKKLYILIAAIAFILIVPFLSTFENSTASYKREPENFEWAKLELHEALPEPTSTYGEIGVDQPWAMSITLHNMTESDYDDYKENCIAAGYTIDSEKTRTSYVAFNSAGYEVRLVYSSDKLYISLDVPEEMSEFDWPSSGVGSLLPATNSNIGRVSWDNSESYIVHVGNTPLSAFSEYIKSCEAAGFNVDYSKSDKYYSAQNNDGYTLTIRYLGFDTIEVSIKAPNDIDTSENSNQTQDTAVADSQDNISPKITATMSEDELEGLTTADAEKALREMGFNIFEYDTLDAGERSDLDGVIGAVEIKSWIFDNGNFDKGDLYDLDATVILWSYKFTEPAKPSPIYYSTNDYKTATQGNTGVFSYIDKGSSYDIYWVIDFDNGYVYYFTDGDGGASCDRLKIESGNLNSNIRVTYHDGDTQWSYKLHFKYQYSPVTLIMVDQNGFEWEYTATNLNRALEVLNTKIIKDY